MEKSDFIIGKILDGAKVAAGDRVLDVACGTGVMIPYYLQRNVAHVTGIDISPEMAKKATAKFPNDPVTVLAADVEEYPFTEKLDRIVVYNAFPHFPEPLRLIRILSGLLAEGGTLTIAHGMSREAIDAGHRGAAAKASCGLMHEDALAAFLRQYLTVTVKISNEYMYQLTAQK